MRSLSNKLVLGTTLGAAAVFVAAGVLLYLLVRTSLLKQFDRSLGDEARLLAATVEFDDGEWEFEVAELDLREFAGPAPAAYLHIWSLNGATQYQSYASTSLDLQKSRRAAATPVHTAVALPDGRRGRIVEMVFLPRGVASAQGGEDGGGPQELVLALARGTRAIDQMLTRLATSLLLVGLVAVGACAAVLSYIVQRGLRPLSELADEIARLGEENLDRSIDVGDAPQEIAPIINRLNDLLRRLDAAIERERSFSANVAHELRNPLAGLRLKMDVATSKSREPAEYEQAIDACRRIATQMQRMVENLLVLARLEAGQVQLRQGPIAIDQLAQECWRQWEPAARERRLTVVWQVPAELEASADESLLRQVIDNVLENAVTYADEGGELRIGAEPAAGGVDLWVGNSGSSVRRADAQRVFDRFWRGDAARSDTGAHCGLGLSLSQKIVAVLGGSITATSEVGGEFAIRIRLPGVTDAVAAV